MTQRLTVPNVFVAGNNIGGDEETEEMAENGELKEMLDKYGISNTFEDV